MTDFYDIIMFCGQSNIAGRGITSEDFPEAAPSVLEGAGYEYRAISMPDALCPIKEPFGLNENNPLGIDDSQKKSGSLVSAFVNAYFEANGGIPLIAISASKGGSSVGEWHTAYLSDAIERLEKCKFFLSSGHYYRNADTKKTEPVFSETGLRHIYMVWCQGETDADIHTPKNTYLSSLRKLFDAFKKHGVEHIFMIQIGECNIPEDPDRYKDMISWQTEFASSYSDVTMVADTFKTMRARGLMKDSFHYYQQGYNEVGALAGCNAGRFTL